MFSYGPEAGLLNKSFYGVTEIITINLVHWVTLCCTAQVRIKQTHLWVTLYYVCMRKLYTFIGYDIFLVCMLKCAMLMYVEVIISYMYTKTYMHTCLCVCIYIYNTCVCIYIYVCVCVFVYI
jgi:hypothetical protein